MLPRIGSYEVVRELGRGGMGIVYAARDPALDRDVAIKVVAPNALDPDGLERFRREGRAAARLRHPNIVGVHALGLLPGGQPYLVMDLIGGESLLARVAREGQLAPAQAARLIAVVARAVEYAHERGVLHRDLKPANVLVDEQGAPHLTDFGLALLTDRVTRLTATGEVMGTLVYMAPEQADGDRSRVGPASDVYGLGATLYELLTGRTPFQGLTGLSALKAVLQRAPDAPSALRPGLDRALEAICTRCLEKEPAARFPSAGALAQALEDWCGVPAPAAGRARSRRRRSVLPWVTGALSLGLVGTGAAWVRAERADAGAAAAAHLELDAARGALDAERAARAAAVADAVAVARQAERARADALALARRPSSGADAELTAALALPGLDDVGRNELQARRAAVRLRLLRHDDARADVEAVLARDPDHRLGQAVSVALKMSKIGASPAGVEPLLRELDALVERAPTLADGFALRGWARSVLRDLPGARADVERSLDLDPLLLSSLRLRSRLRSLANDPRGALDDATVATYLDPGDVNGWQALFFTLMETGDHERARDVAAQALSLQDDPEVRRQLAHVHALEGDPSDQGPIAPREAIELARHGAPKRAERALTRALAQGPELDPNLLAWRALVRLDLDEFELASVDCALVLGTHPEHPLAQLVRASLLKRARVPNAPKQMVADLLERGEPFPEAYAMLALILADEGDLAGARVPLARAKALDPGFGRGDAILAGLLLAEGDLAAGAAAAERAVELAPYYSRSWAMAARSRFAAEDLDGADAAAARCLQLREDPDALFVRGMVSAARGDHATGVARLERAVDLRPVDVTFNVSRVELLLALGRREEAALAAEQGIPWVGSKPQAVRQLRDLQARARGR
jgi:tetratricopeptide (TPR) repeat protein